MTATNIHIIAVRESASAVLAELLKTGKATKISVVPTAEALGFVRFASEGRMIATETSLENRITVLVAGVAAQPLLDSDSVDTSVSSSYQFAIHLAEQVADLRNTNWRRSQPDLAMRIVADCRKKAEALVLEHRSRIISLASELEAKGTLSGAEIDQH